jgi:hypothetical protein
MQGPWRTFDTDRGTYILGPSSSLLAIVQPYHSNVVQNEANARLIASAPDMADTLERQAAEIERLRGALGDLIDYVEANFDSPIDELALRPARAALTGEDS